MKEPIKLTEQLKDQTVAWRRQLHAMAEPSFHETKTAEFVAGVLEELGYSLRTGLAETGLVAELGDGPIVALRAELDGLSLQEANPIEYASKNAGVMHACGHDANMACVLAAASILSKSKPAGKVRVIMQPASEIASDQNLKSGAARMIEDGAIDDVSAIVGLHVDGTIDNGSVGVIEEPVVVKKDAFDIHLAASSGAGMELGARLTLEINECIRRENLPDDCVSVLGLATDGESPNKSRLNGLIAYQSREMFEKIRSVLNKACSSLGSPKQCSIAFADATFTGLDGRVVEALKKACEETLGPEKTKILNRKTWTEDFSHYSSLLPAGMILFGTRLPGPPRVHHTSTFDVDDSCLYLGAAILARATISLLEQS